MALRVQLREDEGTSRLVALAVWSPAEGGTGSGPPDQRYTRDVVPVFVEAIDVGLWGGAARQYAEVICTTAHKEGDARAESWDLRIPAIAGGAFTALARMLWAARAHRVHIQETARRELLTVRVLPAPTTARVAPWQVKREIGDEPCDAVVTVTFAGEPPPMVVKATQRVLKAWSTVVAFGGFAGATGSAASSGVLAEWGPVCANGVTASFERIAVAWDAWLTLWEGLRRIHQSAPITRVWIR